jgi:hypothetical protein
LLLRIPLAHNICVALREKGFRRKLARILEQNVYSGITKCIPGFDSRTRCHMWDFFVGSLPCFECFNFLRVLRCSSLRKIQYFQIRIRPGIEDHLKIIYIVNDVILVKTWLCFVLLYLYTDTNSILLDFGGDILNITNQVMSFQKLQYGLEGQASSKPYIICYFWKFLKP